MFVYFFKRINEGGVLQNLLTYNNNRPIITDPLIIEISEEEYNVLLAEIEAANQPEEPDTDEISDEAALNIILGVSE